ncbi:MAG: mechanosensitive ion channel domain-containing protein [Pseudomonadota bacterium]
MISIEMIESLAKDGVLSLIKWSPKLLGSALILIVGFWLVNRIIRLFDQLLKNRRVDSTLSGFLESFLSVSLKFFVVIAALSLVGVKTTSLVAILGAAGLAVGLALQGSLSNFAGGMLILFFKPFKVGDYIKVEEREGFVEKIMIFNTVLKTFTNEIIILPNSDVVNGVVKNLTAQRVRGLDLTLSVAYATDIDHMREVVLEVLAKDERILLVPESQVYISGHGDNAIEVLVRVWVNAENYWPVNFYLWEEIKKTFDRNQISIPFPQREIHMVSLAKAD